jgi:hypothetical protein
MNNTAILSLSSFSFLILLIIGGVIAWYFLYYKKNQNTNLSTSESTSTITNSNTNTNTIAVGGGGSAESSLVPANTAQLISSNKDLSMESNITDLKNGASPQEMKAAEDTFSKQYIESLELTQPITKTKTEIYKGIAKDVAANVFVGLAAEKIVGAALKIGRKSASKVAFKVGTKAATVATKGIAKVVAKKGANAVAKLGLKSLAKGVALGPFGPFALGFEVLSFGLDQWDPANYNDLEIGNKKYFRDLKNSAEFEIKTTLEEAGSFYPSIVGPFDKLYAQLGEEEFNKLLMEKISQIMDLSKVPLHPLMKPFQDAFVSDLNNGVIKEADLENDELIFAKYEKLIDNTKIFNEAFNLLCLEKGGKTIFRQNDQTKEITPQCSYKDKASCESSYKWVPKSGLAEDNQDLYAEFRSGLLGGACINYNFAVRAGCEDVGLQYDTNEGKCLVTQEFCKSKGADWELNKELGEHDCFIKSTQKVAEMIFGTTITRGVKQGAIAAYNEVDKLFGGGLTKAMDGIDQVFGPFNPITGSFKLAEKGFEYGIEYGSKAFDVVSNQATGIWEGITTGDPTKFIQSTPIGQAFGLVSSLW